MKSFEKTNFNEHRPLKEPTTNYGSLPGPCYYEKTTTSWRTTVIEPIVLIYTMAQVLSETVMPNLFEYRTCTKQLLLPDSNCTEPIAFPIENLIQPTTSHIILARSLMETVVPACLALFIGPWSDVNGRKPYLMVAMAGSAITYLCCAGLVLFPNVSSSMFVAASLPLALSGGSCTANMLMICYVTDITDNHSRPIRLSLCSLAIFTSFMFGTVSTKIISTKLPVNSYFLVFSLSAWLMILCCIYTYWFIEESVDVKPIREKQLFLFSKIKCSFTFCFRKQKGHTRITILLIILSFMLNVFLVKGEATVSYMSTREMFSWQLSDFTVYSIFAAFVYGIGVLTGVWLFKSLLGLPNLLLAGVMLGSHCARCIIMACSTSGMGFYIAVLVSTFYASYTPLCSSELSRIVDKKDLGKVFALSAFFDNISPIISSPVYTYVYQATYLFMPGTIYLLGAAISGTSALLVLIVFLIQRYSKESSYTSSYVECVNEA